MLTELASTQYPCHANLRSRVGITYCGGLTAHWLGCQLFFPLNTLKPHKCFSAIPWISQVRGAFYGICWRIDWLGLSRFLSYWDVRLEVHYWPDGKAINFTIGVIAQFIYESKAVKRGSSETRKDTIRYDFRCKVHLCIGMRQELRINCGEVATNSCDIEYVHYVFPVPSVPTGTCGVVEQGRFPSILQPFCVETSIIYIAFVQLVIDQVPLWSFRVDWRTEFGCVEPYKRHANDHRWRIGCLLYPHALP